MKQKKYSIKKIILTSFIFLALLLTYKYCFSCIKLPIKSDYYEYHPLINDDITLTIKEDSLTKSGMTIVIDNTSDNKGFVYGSCEIEPKIFGVWGRFLLKKSTVENLNMETLLPGEKKEISLDWKNKYGKLTYGKYRVIIQGYVYTDDKNEDEIIDHKTYLAYEFKI